MNNQACVTSCEIDGLVYMAQAVPEDTCAGCAATRYGSDLCMALPDCFADTRSDGQIVIWVLDTEENLIRQRRALRALIGNN